MKEDEVKISARKRASCVYPLPGVVTGSDVKGIDAALRRLGIHGEGWTQRRARLIPQKG